MSDQSVATESAPVQWTDEQMAEAKQRVDACKADLLHALNKHQCFIHAVPRMEPFGMDGSLLTSAAYSIMPKVVQ